MGKETYQGVIGGGLKFKGDGVKKKKKKHSPKTQDDQKVDALSKAAAQTDPKGEEQTAEKASDVRSAEELNKLRESRMTESEKAFARARRERVCIALFNFCYQCTTLLMIAVASQGGW